MAPSPSDRLLGLCLNDVGPVIHRPGLERINDYVGRNPAARTLREMAAGCQAMPGFADVPASRWVEEVAHFYGETPEGLQITYDPALREAFLAAFSGPEVDLWPLFDACAGLPLALIRGANSDLLSAEIAAEMRAPPPRHDLCRCAGPRPYAVSGRTARRCRADALAGGAAMTTLAMITAAAARLQGHVRQTPLLNAPLLDRLAGRRVLVKAECLQLTGRFKSRGGWSAVSALPAGTRGVMAYHRATTRRAWPGRRRRMACRR